MRIAHAQPHEVKKIGAHDIAGGMPAATIGQLNHGRVWIGEPIGLIWVSRIDANIMARFAGDQLAAIGHRPFFQMSAEPVGVVQDETRHFFCSSRRKEALIAL